MMTIDFFVVMLEEEEDGGHPGKEDDEDAPGEEGVERDGGDAAESENDEGGACFCGAISKDIDDCFCFEFLIHF